MTDPRYAAASELQHAIALCDWARAATPTYPELRWMFHPANGEHRDRRTAAKLKATGVKAGVSDYVLPAPRGGYHGLFVELKKLGAYPSPEQREFIADMTAAGYRAVVCKGWIAAKDEIERYLAITNTPSIDDPRGVKP